MWPDRMYGESPETSEHISLLRAGFCSTRKWFYVRLFTTTPGSSELYANDSQRPKWTGGALMHRLQYSAAPVDIDISGGQLSALVPDVRHISLLLNHDSPPISVSNLHNYVRSGGNESRKLSSLTSHYRMVHRILVASYTNEIYTLAFDPSVPSLTLTSALTVGHHPSWITPHSTDKKIVFTALEQSEGKIIVLKLDDEGRAAVVGEGPSGGADPCSLLALDGQLLLGNVRVLNTAKYTICR